MRRLRTTIMILLLATVLSGCTSSPKLGGAEREPMTDEERVEFYRDMYSNGQLEGTEYAEEGIRVTSEQKLEIEAWKLKMLADAYEKQNPLDYVKGVTEIPVGEGEWTATELETDDFKATARVYGDDETMTLELELDESSKGKFVLAPQSSIINGVVKAGTLFKATESEEGLFYITAPMSGFDELSKFGLNVGNIFSVAWEIGAISTETKELNTFIIPASFPSDDTWGGLEVGEKYTASEGIVMWLQHEDDYTYLCTFNGSLKKIEAELNVQAKEGQLISEDFVLNASSGEFVYTQIGFNLEGVTINADGNLLLVD